MYYCDWFNKYGIYLMEYTLYTDKPKIFNCTVDISGASLTETTARMFLETKSATLVFNGVIDGNGNCKINIPRLGNFLKEGDVGKVKLEVIAETTVFTPWESDTVIKTDKKVTVTEIKADVPATAPIISETKPVSVTVNVPKEPVKRLSDEQINEYSKKLSYILNKKSVNEGANPEKLINTYKRMYNISSMDMKRIKNQIK
jgi:hypothetical protein